MVYFPRNVSPLDGPRVYEGSLLSSLDAVNDHKRHRKVLLPGFGGPESRAFWPIFYGYAAQVRGSRLSRMITLLTTLNILVNLQVERYHQ